MVDRCVSGGARHSALDVGASGSLTQALVLYARPLVGRTAGRAATTTTRPRPHAEPGRPSSPAAGDLSAVVWPPPGGAVPSQAPRKQPRGLGFPSLGLDPVVSLLQRVAGCAVGGLNRLPSLLSSHAPSCLPPPPKKEGPVLPPRPIRLDGRDALVKELISPECGVSSGLHLISANVSIFHASGACCSKKNPVCRSASCQLGWDTAVLKPQLALSLTSLPGNKIPE